MRIRLLFFLLIVAGFGESCNVFYVTASPHTPVMDGKNEIYQNCNAGLAGFNEGFSYSPINHFYTGGTLHFFPRSHESTFHLSGGPHIGFYSNTGFGTYHFNLQAGYNWGQGGYGSQRLTGDDHYREYYMQGFIAFRLGQSQNTTIGAGTLYSAASFRYSDMYYWSSNAPNDFPAEQNFLSFFFFINAGFKNAPDIKCFIVGGKQFLVSGFASTYTLEGYLYDSTYLRAGLTFYIHTDGQKTDAQRYFQ